MDYGSQTQKLWNRPARLVCRRRPRAAPAVLAGPTVRPELHFRVASLSESAAVLSLGANLEESGEADSEAPATLGLRGSESVRLTVGLGLWLPRDSAKSQARVRRGWTAPRPRSRASPGPTRTPRSGRSESTPFWPAGAGRRWAGSADGLHR